jgi:hypothetical protein
MLHFTTSILITGCLFTKLSLISLPQIFALSSASLIAVSLNFRLESAVLLSRAVNAELKLVYNMLTLRFILYTRLYNLSAVSYPS